MHPSPVPFLRVLILVAGVVAALPGASAAPWPAWRGPRADGSTVETAFPLRWSPTENVRWRVDLPDRGNSTPIVWGDRVFVTQAVEASHRRLLLAFDRHTGRRLWEAGTTWDRPEETHEDNPHCAASPVTDGERVIASFGSAGILAFDLGGRLLWKRDLGPQVHQWGQGPSPVLHRGHVYHYHGPGKHSRLVALRADDGTVAWSLDLPEPIPQSRTDGFKGQSSGVVGTFGTPLLVSAGGREELVLGLPESVLAVSPDSGSELWRAGGLNPLVYASPLAVGDTVVVLGGFFGSAVAVRAGGAGEVTESRRLWREERSKKNRLGTGVARDGHLYFANMEGFFECLELASGRRLWEERLDGPGAVDGSWSSPTLAGDRIYVPNKSGDTFVLRASPRFEVLAVNSVGEPTNASLAMSDGALFLRTWKALWCLAEGPKS